MCIMNSGSGQRGAAPVVAPAPERPAVIAAATADPTSLTSTAKRTAAKRLGIFGNVTTTPMGDASYGNAVAKFGAAA